MSIKAGLFFALLSLTVSFLVPRYAAAHSPEEPESHAAVESVPAPPPEAAPEETAVVPSPSPAPVESCPDEQTVISLLTEEGAREMTLAEYLPGVLAGEMPAGFPPEALRAQAVAARTYAVRRAKDPASPHPGGAVCSDFRCCQAWKSPDELRAVWGSSYEEKMSALRSAAADTDGLLLLWDGKPALACFHASSAGATEDCAAVWGGEVPYLVSVETPETPDAVDDLLSEVVLTPEELRAILSEAHPEAVFDGSPDRWAGAEERDASGRVDTLTLCGVTLPGTEVRRLFSLRSADFTLTWTGTAFRFSVSGSGHGVGMSQHGARLLAEEGRTWREILAHYYPGTELGTV